VDEPEHVESGPAAGSFWVYFRAPWGLEMELVSYPNGKAYEAGASVKLWHPARPSE
jgi:glyoxylase I family protein